jgi:hypothetical protein
VLGQGEEQLGRLAEAKGGGVMKYKCPIIHTDYCDMQGCSITGTCGRLGIPFEGAPHPPVRSGHGELVAVVSVLTKLRAMLDKFSLRTKV